MKIIELNASEMLSVAGGNPEPGQSWVDYLEENYPGGRWENGSYIPMGSPIY